ncbi:hypothetical protein NWFMUON74_17950 [Nocardia wallacei]|uniref:Uncharacterized protein n=1 Tax=Nocardia wallacei TaxID=480035 RepID=A0A7G1KIJ8_9NOCA|nr:hypothetical protein NWFMUON74_17950 [Nocardia wallacei]
MSLFRDGPAWWDNNKGRWVGGHPTPLSRVWGEARRRGLQLFVGDHETDGVLDLMVRLTDGSELPGFRVARGATAQQIWHSMYKAAIECGRQEGHGVVCVADCGK